jgi:ADP-ribose pyrophosphatase
LFAPFAAATLKWVAARSKDRLMIKPWEKISSQAVGDFRIFTVRSDRKISPRTLQQHDFFVIDCVNWVNVIGVTPDQELVMVEQYRHGSNTVELEIPGGMMDADDGSPEATGVRELREETGYAGEKVRLIGQILPNPAIMSNVCFTALVENCRCRHPVAFDQGEDLLTRLIPIADIPRLVAEGKIQHSLVVVALYHFDLWQRGLRR